VDYRDLRAQAASLMDDGQRLAMDFADHARPGDGSPIQALGALRTGIGSGNWTDDDLLLLVQAIGGFVVVEDAQLTGLRLIFAGGPPVLLRPTVTLMRGLAEA
jgi:hypothetical protein